MKSPAKPQMTAWGKSTLWKVPVKVSSQVNVHETSYVMSKSVLGLRTAQKFQRRWITVVRVWESAGFIYSAHKVNQKPVTKQKCLTLLEQEPPDMMVCPHPVANAWNPKVLFGVCFTYMLEV